ncbi:MarR family winged helix-turn-helix transcriptional regulator [Enterococcus sp. UD-01]|jgi:DNA-binding MarR family transcriptional regulator|uniref:MarR family winged helix-turn-helix transcriptional regulator n=1 Tax=Enterococcus sp. UD-01 TaxID=3373911 RepID=UPI00383299F2
MIENNLSYIANYLWQKSLENIDAVLTKEEKSKFNMADYYYLTAIYHMEEPNLGEVAEKLELTKPAISAMVKRLERIGFIEKQQSTADKRVFYLAVTEKGKNIVEGDTCLYQQFIEKIRQLTTPEQMEQFTCLLEKLVGEIKE